jgi:NADPH:quinone reductase-like Zn-dependent oxidoreductase/acyl carrier protein
VRLWRPLPPAVHSHVRAVGAASRQERSYDATVTDAEGCVLLEVAGFTLRTPEPWREAESAAPGENFSAVIDHPGSLATLGLRPDHRHPPGPGEVEVEVTAAGVNFIEVLYALGMLPEPPGGEVRFGLECAGTVARVGEGVAGLRPGDAVFGFAPRAFSRFTTTAAAHVAPLPPHLSPEAGATLPAAFTTAYYALVTRGRLRCGERVLIHAAAGGVGLAAVTIARWRGAEVFATAGSDTKRDHLRGLGIRHVWDSRSLGFAEGVREATGGQGVDVVLNSLGGEFIPASLGVLARHGRFLELGKRDILGNGALALAPFEKHLSFTAIDVGPDLPEFTRVWRQVVRGIGRREFRPLPHRVFPVTDLAEAFEQMAQARHIGKLVVAMAGAAPGRVAPRRRHGRPLADIIGRGAERVAAEATQPPMPAASRDLAPRAAPLDRAHARPAMPTPYRAPEGATEAGVVAVWEELLGVSGIGADDNFFELRGDSLLAAQVTSRLYAEFQVKLPLSSLFEHPTVAELAARIERQRQSLRELATAPLAQRAETEVEHEL